MPRRLRFYSGPAAMYVLAAAMLILLVPVLAQANSIPPAVCPPDTICVQNSGGTAGTSGGGSGNSFSLSNATVTEIGNVFQNGTLNFSTGTFITGSGTLAAGGMFNGGGSFVVTGTFAGFTGIIFNGSFSGPVSWILDGCNKSGSCFYTLTGVVSGTWYNGEQVSGVTTQLFFKTTKGRYTGGSIQSEDGSTFVVTPEPTTMGLMGTGLLGMGFLVRSKTRRGQG